MFRFDRDGRPLLALPLYSFGLKNSVTATYSNLYKAIQVTFATVLVDKLNVVGPWVPLLSKSFSRYSHSIVPLTGSSRFFRDLVMIRPFQVGCRVPGHCFHRVIVAMQRSKITRRVVMAMSPLYVVSYQLHSCERGIITCDRVRQAPSFK